MDTQFHGEIERALPALLADFYGRVRRDPALGPIFEATVEDWPRHLAKLEDFWSSVMLTTGRYKGNPVAIHLRHKARITPDLWPIWLGHWRLATEAAVSTQVADRLVAKAERIAQSLSLALSFDPAQAAPKTNDGPYRSTPEFDAQTLPAGLRRDHSTKPGVWGVIRVLEGVVRYTVDGEDAVQTLTPRCPGLVRPEQLHHVEPQGAMRMRVDFYDHEPTL